MDLNLETLIKKSNLQIEQNKIFFNEPMKNHTTFKIGGPADCLIKIETKQELKEVLQFSKQNNIPVTIIGNGSNVLVLDKGNRGNTLKIEIKKLEIKENKQNIKVILGAGEKIVTVSRKLAKAEISGMEELSGIPGTIGGAVKMNAGAHGKEIKDIIKKVICIDYNRK